MAATNPTRLFDTTVFVSHLRAESLQATRLIMEASRGKYTAAFSVITEAELWVGVRNEQDQHTHKTILFPLKRLPLTHTIARRAGELRRIYRNRSLKIGDAIVAATAEHYDLPLYTKNVKDFDFIATIKVIPYEEK